MLHAHLRTILISMMSPGPNSGSFLDLSMAAACSASKVWSAHDFALQQCNKQSSKYMEQMHSLVKENPFVLSALSFLLAVQLESREPLVGFDHLPRTAAARYAIDGGNFVGKAAVSVSEADWQSDKGL